MTIEARTVSGNIIVEALKDMSRTEVHSNIVILVRQQLQNHICLKNLNASHQKEWVSVDFTSNKICLKRRGCQYNENICKTDKKMVTKWEDNSVVCTATSGHGVNPLTSVSRY